MDVRPARDTWLCLGGSPSAPAMLPKALAAYPDCTRITTNSGLKLTIPHYYFLSDHLACKMHAERAMELRHTHGMQVITLGRRYQSAIIKRGLTAVDYIINPGRPTRPCDFARHEYTDCMFSGLYCVQFALNNGAKTIVAVGHEGYPSELGTVCYWDTEEPPMAKRQALAYTKNWIGPWWRNAVAGCPEVTFHFYGPLQYAVDGPNVRKTTDADCAVSTLAAANESR